MPTNLPAQPWPQTARPLQAAAKHEDYEDQENLFVVLCFALSPLAILLLLFLVAAPNQFSVAYACSEEQCAAP